MPTPLRSKKSARARHRENISANALIESCPVGGVAC
jgi:hypothetical protein